MRIPPSPLTAAAIFAAALLAAHAQQPTPAQAPTPGLTAEQQALFGSARADFNAGRFAQALPRLRSLHEQAPTNDIIAKFEAEAAVNTGDFPLVTSVLQPILAAHPEDPQALSILVHAYGQQHDIAHRDELLDRMQKLHDAGKLPIPAVIVEKVTLANGGSALIRYFLQPWSRFHIVFMAELHDAADKPTGRIAVESDDIDQVSFARDHPQEAAAGTRIYSMDSYGQSTTANGQTTQTHGTLCPVPNCFMTGRPPYELFRDVVLGKKTAKTTSSTTSTQPTKP